MKILKAMLSLIFCLNTVFLNTAQAGVKTEKPFMLRAQAASRRIGDLLAEVGIEHIKKLSENGTKGLISGLAELVVDKKNESLRNGLTEENIAVYQKDQKTYIVCLMDKGWKADLSKEKVEIEPFASKDDMDKFITGAQLTWLAGDFTPDQIIEAQKETKKY